MERSARSVFAAVVLCAASASLVRGQSDGRPGTVAGSGSVAIRRHPEAMRVEIAIFGIGENIDEALERLKARTDVARKRLIELGASKDSLKVASPELASVKPGRLQQIEMLRARRRGKNAKKSDLTTVTANITADIPLDAKDAEAVLRVAPLKKKIREADLAGLKEMEPLTPEQEEALVQAEAEGRVDPDDENPGDATFQFVARLTEGDRKAAIAEALRKAREDAAILAEVTGGELGRIHSAFTASSTDGDTEDELSFLGSLVDNVVAMHTMQAARIRKGNSADGREVVRKEAAATTFHITVTASFELKSK